MPELLHIIRQILRHPLGQRRNQHFISQLRSFFIDLTDQIIDLSLYRTHLHIPDQADRSAG